MERRTTARPQRVLLVDDSTDLREIWRLWLVLWGFAVEEAPNGAEAVQQARARPPNLIVMDLAMRVLDGRAAIQELARDPATAHIPVLALSAQTYIVPAAAGAAPEFFFPKPTDPDDLLAQVRATLHHRAAAPRLGGQG